MQSNNLNKQKSQKIYIPKYTLEIKNREYIHQNITSIIIPKKVIKISKYAFKNCKLNRVILPKNLKIIGEGAFELNHLLYIKIPNTVKLIDNSAFLDNRLVKVKLPNSLKIITCSSFASNHLLSINLPDTIEKIENDAFYHNHLKKLVLPKNLKIISKYAFEKNRLEKISFNSNLERIGDMAFANNKLKELRLPNSLTYIGEYAFDKNKLKKVILPNSLTKIKEHSFSNNELQSIIIPEKVEVIEKAAFSYNQLKMVKLPNNLKFIGADAFSNNQITTINIPDSVEIIECSAFQNNNLTHVKLPNNLKSIEIFSFENNNLEEIIIPSKVEIIYRDAFYSNSLKKVILNEGVKSIHSYAFAKNKLKEVTIPDSVKFIENSAFDNNVILRNNTVLNDIITIINKINRKKIDNLEEFYQYNPTIKYLCTKLLKLKLKDEEKYQILLKKFEKIYQKTRLQYLPSFSLLEVFDENFINNFNLKIWNEVTNNDLFNSCFEIQLAFLEIIELFGLFNNDSDKYNRLKKFQEIFFNNDYTLTKEQYNRLNSKFQKYFIKKTRLELRLKKNCSIPDDTTLYLKEYISPTRYKYIKKLKGSEGSKINKLLNQLYEQKEVDYYEPDLSKTTIKNISNIIFESNIPGKINIDSIHRIFTGKHYEFNDEIYQFLIKYFNIILEDELLQALITDIIKNFYNIKDKYNLDDQTIPTLKQCYSYCFDNKFDYTFGNKELAKMARYAGVCDEGTYKFYEKLNEEVRKRKQSVLIRSHNLYNYKNITLKGELLRTDASFSMFVGETNLTNCCQCYDGVGEECMKHASTSKEGGIFIVSYLKHGKWVELCQSWDWQNEGVYCHDNIEGTSELKENPRLMDAVVYIYKENAKKIIKDSSTYIDNYVEEQLRKIEKSNLTSNEKIKKLNQLKELKLRQKIKLVTVGNGYNDIILSDYFIKSTKVNRQPKNYHGYSDSKNKQYIISGNEADLTPESSEYTQIPIYRDQRNIHKEESDDIKQSTLKLIHDIEKEVYPKKMIKYSNNNGPLITTNYQLEEVLNEDIDNLKIIYGEDWYLLYSENNKQIKLLDLAKTTPRIEDEKSIQLSEIYNAVKNIFIKANTNDKIITANLRENNTYLLYLMYLKKGLLEQIDIDLEYNYNNEFNYKELTKEEQLIKLKQIKELRHNKKSKTIMHKVKFKPTQKYINNYQK